MARFSNIYIDKSILISRTNALYRTEKRFVCVSRPRRFGKSMAANMLSAYYSCGCDSAELFAELKIASDPLYQAHLNQHHVIRLNMQHLLENQHDIITYISELENRVILELMQEFPECTGYGIKSRL